MSDLEARLDALSAQLSALEERQRRRDELFEELTPIVKEMLGSGGRRLGELEQRGYFAFGRELLGVVDQIVQGYTPEDVHMLGESIVAILDTVRSITQPHVLRVTGEVGDVVEHAEQVRPVGMIGAIRKASKDEEIQRGIAVTLETLKRVGHGAAKVGRRERLRRQLAPRSAPSTPPRPTPPTLARPKPARAAAAAHAVSPRAAGTGASALPVPKIEGVPFTDEGFMADHTQWTREIAQAMAASIGVQLTERHWALLEFARAEYASTGMSPNIRRLSKGSGIGTKEIYAMFPRTPGKYTALIAGLPKPVGCI